MSDHAGYGFAPAITLCERKITTLAKPFFRRLTPATVAAIVVWLTATSLPFNASAGPLHNAARTGDIAKIKALLAKKSAPDKNTEYQFSPLLLAQSNGHEAAAELLLKSGAKNDLKPLIRLIQASLTLLQIDTGGIDGLLGPASREAISRFQQREQLQADETLNENWVKVLRSKSVQALQQRLTVLELYGGEIDGKLSGPLRQSIRAAEKQLKLTETGLMSAELLSKLAPPVADSADGGNSANTDTNPTKQSSEIVGELVFEHADGTLIGCSIKQIQLDLGWCAPFVKHPKLDACKVILRPDSSVLFVKCG